MKSRGLGDDIANFTKKTGIKKMVDTMSKGLNIPCGCEGRQEAMNILFPKITPEDFEILRGGPKMKSVKISPACTALAKKKFKVWPSAYASAFGVKCTKAGGPSKMNKKKK